mmetsp:Transcript_4041/g.16176  ORF Transcript_4041/g.16176 Transcript_4041/m.16176 type:complete len:143 (+) Transcript_4041:1043-1471(+)
MLCVAANWGGGCWIRVQPNRERRLVPAEPRGGVGAVPKKKHTPSSSSSSSSDEQQSAPAHRAACVALALRLLVAWVVLAFVLHLVLGACLGSSAASTGAASTGHPVVVVVDEEAADDADAKYQPLLGAPPRSVPGSRRILLV